MYSDYTIQLEDPDARIEELYECLEEAQRELIIAVGFFPRYKLEAEWLADSDARIMDQMHTVIDAMNPDDLAARREGMCYLVNPFQELEGMMQ